MQTDKLNKYSSELYTLIKHTQSAVNTQKTSDKVTHSKAADLLHELDRALSEQLRTFEGFEDLIQESNLNSVKEKLASFSGAIAGAIDTQREDTVSKMLRDNYTALGMIASGYTMLHTLALGTGSNELASFTKESLTTIAGMVTEVSRILPHVVASELNMEEIAEQAEEETQECWEPENMMAGV